MVVNRRVGALETRTAEFSVPAIRRGLEPRDLKCDVWSTAFRIFFFFLK